ncbi:hypothetical protein [Yoonia sediminilitoris]|uniref:TVP38/TMEM64 family membrane protein n=1 Tax=Yoonia sediminilitoris TaxID=1286148 RepID=A0A2T6K8I1_9RHOB|nr:hypothetical protein [Yoonia sediminilitoris]PUB11023.1 hypothetical protein C8N45_1154 [Yoonia sediminilitoris]RCW90942.1 hypothetical protein DFP92_1154 [Yoonia sediminilitoris]
MATIIRGLLRVAALLALIFFGHEVIAVVSSWLEIKLMPHTEDMLHRSIVAGTIVYVVLMAIPFVPGAEIGLTLLTALGGALAPLVYLATAVSLMTAYLVGRLMPASVLQRGLSAVGLARMAALVGEAATLTDADLQQRLATMTASPFLKSLLRYRYIALALAVNMPGNIVIGGGGGIALMAGLSRMFTPVSFLLTILIAVLPVPLLFYVSAL